MDYRIDSRELDGNNVTLSGRRRRGDSARQLVIMHKGAPRAPPLPREIRPR